MASPFFFRTFMAFLRRLAPAAGVATRRQRRIVRHPIRRGGFRHALRCPGDVGNDE